ncbi:hypothetical protein FRUB_04480 [Fimbriiglobus ruber]|uniref:ParB/Sulfiredoxin domain-containing protein n=2 Tax=Fimbriiglobus ruber TaxID=1908690 RepID=A0A225DLZ7_9BACT|nr:hypothetical protein FRUB_04480 [Fimbriiglobus ruber]
MGKADGLTERPELKWIKLTELYVPADYQRPAKNSASLANINYIRNNFNWASCGALIVCQLAKSRQFAIIDGQHRFRAAEAHGRIAELPCLVISPREAQDQARHFVEVNSKRIKLHNLHEYRAAVVAGDPNAIMVAGLLKRANISVPEHPTGKKQMPPRSTVAIGTLFKMLDTYSEKQILWALTVIPEAYEDEPGVLRASLIKAMAEWIKRHPDTDRETMIRTLQDIDLDDLEKDARAYRAIEGKRMPDAIMLVLEKKYHAARKAA